MKKKITSYVTEAIDKSKTKYTLAEGTAKDDVIHIYGSKLIELVRDAFVSGVQWREEKLEEDINQKRKL